MKSSGDMRLKGRGREPVSYHQSAERMLQGLSNAITEETERHPPVIFYAAVFSTSSCSDENLPWVGTILKYIYIYITAYYVE